jgi:dihydroorotate dehydrogenase (fumarate)
MIDLSTTYLGLKLKNPLVPSASTLTDEIGSIRKMEDAGAAAIVLHSLFEEQLRADRVELFERMTHGTESFPEALTYFPEPPKFELGPETYLEHIRKAKAAVDIPVMASLNGSSAGGWIDYAQKIQQAGADALELNLYFIPADLQMTGAALEERKLEVVRAVKSVVTIPVAVKCSPFFTNMANMAYKLDKAGADGLVLFNRFYQPDIDIDELEIRPNVLLSTPQAARLPLTWIGILYGRIKADLAATSGIHQGRDAIKMIMAGAKVTQVCSSLYRNGTKHLSTMEREMREWMEKNEYESVQQMRGSMSQKNCADPAAFERAQYMRAIQKPPMEKV